MLRACQDSFGLAGLDRRALVENRNLVADLVGGREIMSDVEERDTILVAHPPHDVRIEIRNDASTIETGSSAMIRSGRMM